LFPRESTDKNSSGGRTLDRRCSLWQFVRAIRPHAYFFLAAFFLAAFFFAFFFAMELLLPRDRVWRHAAATGLQTAEGTTNLDSIPTRQP
jgi:hypothetical protein